MNLQAKLQNTAICKVQKALVTKHGGDCVEVTAKVREFTAILKLAPAADCHALAAEFIKDNA